MTIPNLTHSIRTKVLETQFKNSTAKLNQAIKRAKYELDVDTLGAYCSLYQQSKYVNSKDCIEAIQNAYNSKGSKKTTSSGSYSINRTGEIKNFNGTKNISIYAGNSPTLYYPTQMLDNTYIGLYVMMFTLNISVDINGEKGPNKLGHDIFILSLSNKNDTIIADKWEGSNYTQEQIDKLSFESSSDYWKAAAGNPCSKTSPQELNGIGCGWYALHDICPFDGKPGYFRCLPK